MQTVEEIEKAIISLPKKDLARLRKWYDEFEARQWDQSFEDDATSGALDRLADKAIKDFKAGAGAANDETLCQRGLLGSCDIYPDTGGGNLGLYRLWRYMLLTKTLSAHS